MKAEIRRFQHARRTWRVRASQAGRLRARPVLWVLLGVAAVAGPLAGLWVRSLAQPSLPVHGEVPEFSFIERSGRTLSLAELRGKVWIANFIFTHCGGPCPFVTAKMKDFTRKFSAEPDIRFVSFTVDPRRDTPEVLAGYASRYGADAEKWFFLTGEEAAIYRLIREHFKLGVEAEGQAAGALVNHSLKFALVDREGRIRGYYDSQWAEDLERLRRDARTLLGETAGGG